ncbi:hypothetical protein RHMOL_Rhmol08G0177600 [Rhododendron molle]|uniref:Uncharacterized protein n=1 Tax=Rhododendron molle TaxID=49168 RepID=A0ACC0MPU0_RHOML|nr:hypothetical protein RHMOL_Rhmol08G0177600 [Rhododendron molle]
MWEGPWRQIKGIRRRQKRPWAPVQWQQAAAMAEKASNRRSVMEIPVARQRQSLARQKRLGPWGPALSQWARAQR